MPVIICCVPIVLPFNEDSGFKDVLYEEGVLGCGVLLWRYLGLAWAVGSRICFAFVLGCL